MENNILVVAKTEYTTQLQEILCRYIFEGISSLWENVKSSNEKQLLKKFQEKLCNIPKWNQDIINGEYNRVIQKISKDYLDKLIEAVFLSNVKILSVVKLNSKSAKTINVTVPETKHFIHMCYVETARHFYSDPYLIEDRERFISSAELHKNIKKIYKVISDSIEKTIRRMIPMEDILDKYLKQETEELEAGEAGESESEGSEEDVKEAEEKAEAVKETDEDDTNNTNNTSNSSGSSNSSLHEKTVEFPPEKDHADDLFMKEVGDKQMYGFPPSNGTAEVNNGFVHHPAQVPTIPINPTSPQEHQHELRGDNLNIKVEKEHFFTDSDSE